MAILSNDDLLAALPGQRLRFFKPSIPGTVARFTSLWTAAGRPGAGATPGSIPGTIPDATTPGAIPFVNPIAPNLSYLVRGLAVQSQQAMAILYDRLVHSSGLNGTLTSAQAVGTPTVNRPDSSGAGVEIWIEIYTALGATAPTYTVSYTNQNGVAGQIGTGSITTTSPPVGTMIPIVLQAGDTGARSVESVTLSVSSGSVGNFGVTLVRPLVEWPIASANVGIALDAVELGMPQVPDNACLALMTLCSVSSTGVVLGSFNLIQTSVQGSVGP